MNASQCVAVRSSWIAMVILMCDNTLSVLFKDGACCNYPRTTVAHFRAMLAAPSKGKWLHHNLYRILPYRRIALPCPAAGCVLSGCCGSQPNIIHVTVTGGGGSVPLTWDGSRWWASAGAVALSCGDSVLLRFGCATGPNCDGLTLQASPDDGVTWSGFQMSSCACSPLAWSGSLNMGPTDGFTHCNGALNATVTT